MSKIGETSRAWGLAALAVTLGCASACRRDDTGYKTNGRASSSASPSQLDGMQLSSARRVARESATDAMRRRDLERLKQLSLWVRGRAQVAIFEADDLQALDVAIQCLEQATPPSSALTTLDAIASGELRKAARDVCTSPARKP